MKKLICVLMAAMMLLLCGCSSSDSESPDTGGADYTDAASFEKALNNGEDAVGKTVTFTIREINTYSSERYNLISGEHLNFVTPMDREYKVGETVTTEVKYLDKLPFDTYTSWIINDDERQLDSFMNDYIDKEINKLLDSSAAEKEFKEKVLYDKKGLKVTLTGIDTRYSGAELKVLIENNTSVSYTVQCRDFSINDFSLSEVFSAEVGAGKKAVDSITVYGMDDAGITVDEIKNVELKLHFYDSDKWSNSFDSEMIRFTL